MVLPDRGVTSSRGVRPSNGGACSLVPCHRSVPFVTLRTPGELLDWGIGAAMGVTMVGNFLSAAFTHDELLAGRLASCTILGTAAPVSRSESVMS